MKSSNNKLVKVGRILEAKGLRGEVKVLFFSGDVSIVDDIDCLFVGDKELEIENVGLSSKPDRINIKFFDIDNRNAAEALKGQEVFVKPENLESKPGEEIFLREILGFSVFNKGEKIGEVESFESNLAQDLLVVQKDDAKKVLIPLIKQFIVHIDFENKKLEMDLPDGLVEESHAL